jgi:hypothetical protein
MTSVDFALILARLSFCGQLLVGLDLFLFVVAAAALRLLLLEARTAFLEHPEIMVGILEVIFGLDAIPGQLRIARQRLIFFQKLRSIAALAIVLPIAGTAGHALRALSAATTTAALTIVDQLVVSLSHWRRQSRSPQFFLP